MRKDIFNLTDPYEIAKYIKDAKKMTPVKAYITGNLADIKIENIKLFGNGDFWVAIGDYSDVKILIENNTDRIVDFHLENDIRNSAIPQLDLTGVEARIEPGAFVRNGAVIGDHSVIMMGAIINIGAVIGEYTMVDMNAVVGARAQIGRNAHIGAGAVVAGVLEPPSADPVVIGDDVLIGANAVVLEGVKVGNAAVVAAGAIVTTDVPEGTVVAGSPARIVKERDAQTDTKTKLIHDLRFLD